MHTYVCVYYTLYTYFCTLTFYSGVADNEHKGKRGDDRKALSWVQMSSTKLLKICIQFLANKLSQSQKCSPGASYESIQIKALASICKHIPYAYIHMYIHIHMYSLRGLLLSSNAANVWELKFGNILLFSLFFIS